LNRAAELRRETRSTMAESKDIEFDEDEDLFDFPAPADAEASAQKGDDEFDIAEFLSTIDDKDVGNIVDLAASVAPTAEAAAAAQVAGSTATNTGVITRVEVSVPLWRQRGVLAVLAAVGLLLVSNLVGTWFAYERNRSVVEEIEGVRLDLRSTVESARRDIQAETSRLEGLTQPRAAVQIGSVSFQTIESHITANDFATARRLLYGKLAILDRLAPNERDPIEARALFLLAEADRSEAALIAASEVGS
jgi:hypothetical protein